MRAIVIDEPGGPEVLQLREVPDPVPGPEEVLVDVVSSALNRADVLQRKGLYPGPRATIEIPGLEFAGRVAAVGDRARRWSVGDAVMGIVAGGAHAERVTIHERAAVAVPANLPLDEAGAVPEVFFTAFDALVVQGAMTSGRWALVHAGASGVGTAAIQIMKAIGASVVVTASAGKLAPCLALGADAAIDYGEGPFSEAVLEATGGVGVDCVLDVIGGDYLDANLDCVRSRGRIIQVGTMGAGSADISLGKLMVKRVALVGTVLRSRPIEDKISLARRFEAEMLPLIASGALVPVIDSRYPLERIADAHRHMEKNANVGKIVLTVAA